MGQKASLRIEKSRPANATRELRIVMGVFHFQTNESSPMNRNSSWKKAVFELHMIVTFGYLFRQPRTLSGRKFSLLPEYVQQHQLNSLRYC